MLVEESKEQGTRLWVPSKIIITEVIIIAGLTAIAYLAAFACQYSYLGYFGIPWSFIEINLATVLFTTLAFASWMSFVIFSIVYLATLKDSGWRGSAKKIGVGLVFFVGIFFPIALVLYDPTSVRWTLIGWFVLVIAFIGLMFNVARNEEKPKKLPDVIIDGIEEKHGSFFVFVLLFSILFLFGSFAVGSILAKSKEKFLIIGRNSSQAVISVYSGNLVTLSFSTSTKKFNNEILLISLDKISTDGLILVNDKIGPLTP